ncbi:hypothetical protein PFISCL1PPCAC_24657 [Pristionchus fissidentatus]|uniref:Cation/H+ exchanger transmembrane domain-containing protein n=1 Tax=Pristionchus fissidentatus TaxID=1538716 RepID=A0AAV5WS30_9BILA|nr:hypothetical protein PFISCL1PPCAC_24657 [Pristionchus fissidentatus]
MTESSGGKAGKRSIRGEVSASLDFIFFSIFSYIIFVSLFGRKFVAPFAVPTVGNSTTDHDRPFVDYGSSTATVLFILLIAIALGRVSEWATGLSLLGMLLAGISLSNLPLSSSPLSVPMEWSSVLRKAAFVVILLRGGLSLDGEALKKMKGACLRLAFFPCTVEALVVALTAKLLFGVSILFGLMLGFVLAAVSPAVVVPSMIRIAQDGYGSGVSSLVVAAASLDDVYAITLFSLCFSILFSTGDSIVFTIIRAPLEVIGGCVLGGIIGYMNRYTLRGTRLLLFLSSAMAMFFGCARLSIDSAGALSVLVSAFVAAGHWRQNGEVAEMETSLKTLWELFFQPLLFGLIGFELTFSLLSWRLVLLGLLVLVIGVAARTAVAFLAVMGSGMTSRERLFVALAWIPKATVQAALAPVALEMTRRGEYGKDYEEGALIVFSLAVLSILTTAPIGAAVIRITAPLLLKKDTVEESKSTVEMRTGSTVEDGEEMETLKSNGSLP